MDLNLIAPCGIDCANCDLFAANGKREVWEYAAKRLGKQAEAMACPGCRANKGCVLHADCATYECVTRRDLNFCGDCAEFPCRKLMPAADGASFYPHNLKLYNLGRIKLLGMEGFLAEAVKIRERYYKGKFVIGEGPQDKE